jgi:hypothetical protein
MTTTETKAIAKKPASPARKSAVKTPAKAAPKAPVKGVAKAVTKKPVEIKPAKVKKPKMVRDSFTMPKPEFAVLDVLKLRAAKLSVPTKKTELIRAGIKALAAMSDVAFLAAVKAVPNLKTGRPAKA